jgi:hypothetical protein
MSSSNNNDVIACVKLVSFLSKYELEGYEKLQEKMM